MSDTAIFIAATAEDLKSNSGLPGDIRALRNLAGNQSRIIHTELLVDSPVPGGFLGTLNQNGVWVSMLPQAGDAEATLLTGLMTRLHEFVHTFPNVSQFVLAGLRPDRLAASALFLQRQGYSVLLCGPDRNQLDPLRFAADDTAVWSGQGGSQGGGRGNQNRGDASRDNASRDNSSRDNSNSREEKAALDPFEVLVDEVTKSRKRGHRVLLTSLKQRMRKRIRRFDETRLKDKDGKPMRKFKDFVLDAANRGLIQLIEKGNASHVLLPDESVDADDDADDVDDRDQDLDVDSDDNDGDDNVDPLLDAVDTVEGDEDDNDDVQEEEEADLSTEDIDVDEIDEDASPPPAEFMEVLVDLLSEPITLDETVRQLNERKQSGKLDMNTRTIRKHLQSAFNNELIERSGDDKPAKFLLVDDWKDIIDYL